MNELVVAGNEMPFSSLFKAYLNEEKSVLSFFQRNPFQFDSYFENPNLSSISRDELVELIKDFNSEIDLGEESLAHIEALRSKETHTVVTGQQIGLFGGYLYTIYKTVTCIKLAQELTQKSGKKVVPFFWIADEDHDFEEANHCIIPKADSSETLKIGRTSTINQQVGREFVPDSIQDQIQAFFETSGQTEFSTEFQTWLETDFNSKHTLKTAFLSLLNRLFGKYGLVFFGSDTAKIKQAVLPVLKKAILESDELFKTLEKTSKEVDSVFNRQAQTDASVLFLNCEKGRIKLQRNQENDTWLADSHLFTTTELVEKISTKPEIVSPNVFLRPILQEYLLPNLAYVAGPGEVAYYAQMKELFHFFDVGMPAIVPRLSFTLIDRPFQRYWAELPLELTDFFQRIEDVEKMMVNKQQPFDIEAHFNAWLLAVKQASVPFKPAVVQLDASLEQAFDRAFTGYANELEKLKGKAQKAIKQKDEVLLQRVRRVHQFVYPLNNLQERVWGFAHFLNKYGLNVFDSLFKTEIPSISKNHLIHYI